MTNKEFFKLVPARQFFTVYAPDVKRFYQKMRGIDGNKMPIDFTEEDKRLMKEGVKRLANDLKRVKF